MSIKKKNWFKKIIYLVDVLEQIQQLQDFSYHLLLKQRQQEQVLDLNRPNNGQRQRHLSVRIHKQCPTLNRKKKKIKAYERIIKIIKLDTIHLSRIIFEGGSPSSNIKA
jgi:hypothetical protein